jgi:serine/threonine protein kinase
VAPSHIGRYKVIEPIGRGGMASVYLARDPAIDRLVAIKLLKEEFDEDQRRRFTQEALLAGRLPHINIITIYDVGDHEGRPFIAMSYIQGETLAQLIQRRARLSIVRKLRIMEELCAGLQAAHNEGIVHRDIKPANVMVDQSGVVKILDFGIARLLSEGTLKTQDGTIIGSYNYMSPEQISGKPLDHRSDIFAVGTILYELVSYTRAFKGGVGDGLLWRVVHEHPPPLQELDAQLEDGLERILKRALEKDPGRRYADIEAMRRDLSRVKRRLADTQIGPLLKQAEEALQQGDLETVLAKTNEALAIDSDDARALDLVETARVRTDARNDLEQARALHDSGRHRDALKHIEGRLTRIPDEWSDLRDAITALRDQVEDALTWQVIELEPVRESTIQANGRVHASEPNIAEPTNGHGGHPAHATGFFDYVTAAFNARPIGMFVAPNWVGLAAFGILGINNPGFWVLGAVLELGYLLTLATNRRFQTTVAAKPLTENQADGTDDDATVVVKRRTTRRGPRA